MYVLDMVTRNKHTGEVLLYSNRPKPYLRILNNFLNL